MVVSSHAVASLKNMHVNMGRAVLAPSPAASVDEDWLLLDSESPDAEESLDSESESMRATRLRCSSFFFFNWFDPHFLFDPRFFRPPFFFYYSNEGT